MPTFHVYVFVQYYFEREGLPFISLADTMRTFLPPGTDARRYTTDYMHFGSVAQPKIANGSFALSSLAAQKLMGAICAN